METSANNSAAEPTANDKKSVNPLEGKVIGAKAAKDAAKLLEAAKKQAAASKSKTSGGSKKDKAPKKEKGPTIAHELDTIILKGGEFDELVKAAQEASDKLGGTMKYTTGVIKAHIRYREIKNPKYLGNLKQTDKGLFPKPERKKKVA